MPSWPRRHRFQFLKHRLYYGHRLRVFRCVYCDKYVMLEPSQLRDMPWSLARCETGVRLTLWQWVGVCLFDRPVDCYDFRQTL